MKNTTAKLTILTFILSLLFIISGTVGCDSDDSIISANSPENSDLITQIDQGTDKETPINPVEEGPVIEDPIIVENPTIPSTSPESDPSPIVNDNYYPIILCNGFAGTDYILMNLVEFMYQIKSTLENTGREVYYAEVPAFNNSEVRAQVIADTIYNVVLQKIIEQAQNASGEDTVTEEAKLQVDLSNMKFNLVCHSQGGINARYAVRMLNIPDPRYDDPATAPQWPAAYFVSSITMLSTPNTGTYVAEWISEDAGSFIVNIAEVVGDFYEGILNGDDPDQASLVAAGKEMAEANMKENMNPMLLNGQDCSHIRIFHWSASMELFHLFHTNNPFIRVMKAINEMDPTEERKLNDGVVCTISAEWQPSLADYTNAGADSSKGMNWEFMGRLENVDHFQLINQILGNLGLGFPHWDPITFYENHSETLDNEGL